MWASDNGHQDTVRVLAEAGADLNLPNLVSMDMLTVLILTGPRLIPNLY